MASSLLDRRLHFMFLFNATQAPTADRVTTAIQDAATKTGADFQYLLTTAQRESSLNPTAHAPNSSASGLFQFLDSTWLQMVKDAGPSYGLSAYADQITKTDGGRYVADPSARQAILDLRNDPALNATMAGAFTQMNSQYLQDALGRKPSSGELYVAHFMGASGAAKLISMATNNGDTNAAAAFPHQAGANRSIFYDRNGAPRTVAQVYANLVSKFDASNKPADTTASISLASASASVNNTGIIKISTDPAAWLAVPAHNAYAIETNSPFHSLFRTDVTQPISDHVKTTWSGLATPPTAVSAIPPAAPADVPAYPAAALKTTRPVAAQTQAIPALPADVPPYPVEMLKSIRKAPRQVPLPVARPCEVDAAGARGGVAQSIGSFVSSIFAASQAAPLREGKS